MSPAEPHPKRRAGRPRAASDALLDLVADLQASGMSLRVTARWLTDQKIPTPRRTEQWDHSNLRNVLRTDSAKQYLAQRTHAGKASPEVRPSALKPLITGGDLVNSLDLGEFIHPDLRETGEKHTAPSTASTTGEGNWVVTAQGLGGAPGPRLLGTVPELDHYLERLLCKPGALPGSTVLEKARAAGKFTPIRDHWWAAARTAHGLRDGTRAPIEVLSLQHRHLRHKRKQGADKWHVDMFIRALRTGFSSWRRLPP
ncbi:recombinase family protein [Nocardia sp. NBC_01503]|uniref:recombinase family protein n=1 Tax=Nocardia sp. NBC_01503 TaxID=2975997 RepID=UPI003FA535BD